MQKSNVRRTKQEICVSKFCCSEVSSSRPSSTSVKPIPYSCGPKSSTTVNVLPNTNTEILIVESSLESIDWLGDVDDPALAAVPDDHTIFANVSQIPKTAVSTAIWPITFIAAMLQLTNYSPSSGSHKLALSSKHTDI